MILSLILGKTILITGAAGGIGSCLCREMGRSNRILALDVDSEGLKRLVEDLKADGVDIVPLQADVRERDSVRAALAAIGNPGVDILVNNAGGSTTASFHRMEEEDWRRDLDVNLTGAWHCFEAVREGMEARGAGVVINVGSANGITALGHPAYSAAKAGLQSFTRSVAMEYGRSGIRANIVLPGTVKTQAWLDRVARNPQVFDQVERWYPMGRLVTPEDIAHTVIFLASDYARAITGAQLLVDGGLLCGNRGLAHDLTQDDTL